MRTGRDQTSQTNKTQRQSTSCSSSRSSDFNTSRSPCFSPAPLHTLLASERRQEILHFHRTAFLSVGLLQQGNVCFMVAIALPASDWKFNRQALEMLFFTLSSPHTHQKANGSMNGSVCLWINAPLSRLLVLRTLEEKRPSFESMISLTGHIKCKT